MVTRGLSERHALRVVHMSAAALRYVPQLDPDPSLRDRIVALAHRHRRYGAGMIYLKLRQEGRRVNHKRVDRLYAEARLQVRRRRRKKVPLADRQPLARPQVPNEVWSADFVFDLGKEWWPRFSPNGTRWRIGSGRRSAFRRPRRSHHLHHNY